jgi:hypothetical protein
VKKTTLLILLISVMSCVAYAQLGLFSKGLIGGLNMASLGGSDASGDARTQTGFAGGVFLELNIPGPFSIEAEGLYSQKGSKYSGTISSVTDTYAYADIPVLLKYYFPLPVLRLYLYGGPMYSIVLSANRKTEVAYSSTVDTDIKDMMAAHDVGGVVGIGARFSIVRIDARYTLGLSTIDKNGTLKVYNRVAALYGGIEF